MSAWKPGDVALVTYSDGETDMALRLDPSGWAVPGGTLVDRVDRPLRPLVVIDPEDREQVERLTRAFFDASPRIVTIDTSPDVIDRLWVASLQAALRSLTTDPKPDEPQGLGAVVEAIYNNHYVHIGGGLWQRVGDGFDDPCDYANIDVVRVLSEGVTS